MNSRIKNIIFDWGGVLIDVTLDKFLAECKSVDISFENKEITGTHKTGFFLEYELGNISDNDARNELRRRAGKYISDAEIDRIWNTTNAIHWDNVAPKVFSYKGLGINDFFKKVFLSHEMHLAKPDTAIYLKALSDAGIKAEETMFIDDSKLNCDAAQSVGINAVHYIPGEDLSLIFK